MRRGSLTPMGEALGIPDPLCVTTKPRDIRQLASECSQIMAGVYYVVTLAT